MVLSSAYNCQFMMQYLDGSHHCFCYFHDHCRPAGKFNLYLNITCLLAYKSSLHMPVKEVWIGSLWAIDCLLVLDLYVSSVVLEFSFGVECCPE